AVLSNLCLLRNPLVSNELRCCVSATSGVRSPPNRGYKWRIHARQQQPSRMAADPSDAHRSGRCGVARFTSGELRQKPLFLLTQNGQGPRQDDDPFNPTFSAVTDAAPNLRRERCQSTHI